MQIPVPLTQRHHEHNSDINSTAADTTLMGQAPFDATDKTMQRLKIAPAKLLSNKAHLIPGQLLVTELRFEVPLDHSAPDGRRIRLFGRLASKREVPIFAPDASSLAAPKPIMVYLEGGPGFGNREPQDHPLTRHALGRGYQVLLLDHRGVGLSTPVSAEMLRSVGPEPQAQADYLKLMRQDNTVRDCEAVRLCLTNGWPEHKAKWSIFGQSYGGFISTTYLSMHPEGLREVFLTGGLPPIGKTPTEVYQATFRKVIDRNAAYHAKFREDADTMHKLAEHIEERGGIALPSGGKLTVPRLLTLGLAFGGHGGFDSVHNMLLTLRASLEDFGHLSRAALVPIESANPLDTNIIYAILHEAIYCDGPGMASAWAAYRVGATIPEFKWLSADSATTDKDQPLHFSGEMIFPFHFDTYPELMALKEVAEILARFDEWPALYDQDQLAQNTVPVYAASFIEDMYVDYELAKNTAKMIRGCKVFETNVMYHTALRAKAEEVLQGLFSLRDDVLD